MLGKLITWMVVGIIAIVALKFVLGLAGLVLGTAFGLAMFLLFRVLPLLVLVWLLYKGWQMLTRPAGEI